MKVERITPIPLDKKQALKYAAEAAREQLGKKVKKAKYLGGGSFGRAVLIRFFDGEEIVVKLLRANGMMKKEVYDLTLLSEHCTVKMPKVIFSRSGDTAIPTDLYGMERVKGKNAFFSLGLLLQSKHKRLRFADEVTSALHAIHECTADKFGDTLNPDCDDWLDYYKPFAEEVLRAAEQLFKNNGLDEKIITAMRAAWKKFDVIFSEKVETACLIHGDLNIANVMTCKNGIAFIDPLNSAFADREYDLFQFDNLTGKRFFLRQTYTKKYGASKYCAQKLAFYGLWNEVFCYIKSGVLVNFIMKPLVKNMLKQLETL